uniref:Uncharacterized protein n=1 Tax=Kalanchoe fedtschenkoi TaxID=63787 RepID=A0A7N0TWK7_KALFE
MLYIFLVRKIRVSFSLHLCAATLQTLIQQYG